MRILYHYFLLTVFLLFNVPDVGASRQLFAIHPVIYPYPVEPMEYPEYSRRPYPALSWSDFDHRTQFVAGRNVPSNETELADVPGLVYRPGASFLKNQEFTGKLQYIGKHGMYLHNIGGYGPGSPFYGSFGEYIVPEWQTEQIRKHLGHRFTGFDVGEQDGRFNFTYKQIMEPYIPDFFETEDVSAYDLRLDVHPNAMERVLSRVVFPTPGRSSSSTWPPASTAMIISRILSRLPTMIFSVSSNTRPEMCAISPMPYRPFHKSVICRPKACEFLPIL